MNTLSNDGRLTFRPRARIIRTIGDQLISGPEAAVIELVKNAYDADVTRVVIRFVPPLTPGQGRITVHDDGHGMTLSDIQDRWMEPATASKLGNRRSPGRQRLMMGSKGIGRFAAAKLGGRLVVRSVSERSGARIEIMVGEIDWTLFDGDTYLEDVSIGLLTQATEEATGTEIEIRSLTEAWSREKLERLLLELRRLISPLGTRDDVFRIILDLSACTETTTGFDGAALVEGNTGSLPGDDRQDLEPFEVRPFPLLTACDYEVVGAFDADGTFTGSMEIRRAGQGPAPISFTVPLQHDEDPCGPVGVRFFLFDREAEAVKALAARRGSKAADFYVETVETFIRDHMSAYRHLFAIENDAVHISVNVPVRFAHAVRDAAIHRRVTPNELVFTAVSHELEMAGASAE